MGLAELNVRQFIFLTLTPHGKATILCDDKTRQSTVSEGSGEAICDEEGPSLFPGPARAPEGPPARCAKTLPEADEEGRSGKEGTFPPRRDVPF